MYSNSYTMNNPYVADPQTRFPDISSPPPINTQATSWGAPAGFPQQQQPQQQYQNPSMMMQPQQQQQQPYGGGYNPTGMQSPVGFQSPTYQSPTGFQPQSGFGQQLNAAMSGSSYGYLTGQQQPQQQQQAGPAQQQLQSPGYVAQFDPYASLGTFESGMSQQQQQQQQQQTQSTTGLVTTGASSTSAKGEPHPRTFIRAHRDAIARWDGATWIQLFATFDALQDAWRGRKREIDGTLAQIGQQTQVQGWYYAQQTQPEVARLQGLAREAESHADGIAAGLFQIKEAFQGYRQSGDQSSKSLVRQAANAALNSLPDWPPLTY
ncbi:hypothetical protein BD626DRAFT_455398 [Schizophyllum amplum]|uniref:Uncharacterized protein n=1 Tax=Schizophyllum amplum TaxID=97359 RepID=A0A550CHF9_9AGAR|nr:hypothetical protein BD626DRAFT_455398 [Auriculariopsis ampla]